MSEQPVNNEGRAEEEVRRLMNVLRTLARMMGYSNREVERRGNLNHATAAKYFQGEGEPKMELVLKIVDALGLDYAEFFSLAYAGRHPESPTAAAERIHGMLEGLQPTALYGTPPPRKPADMQDYEKMRQVVRDVLEEVIGQPGPSKVTKFRRRS